MMKIQSIIYVILFLLSGVMSAYGQNNAIVEFEGESKAFILPVMDSFQRNNIDIPPFIYPTVLGNDGLLIYDKTTQSVEHYDAYYNTWVRLMGIDGANGASGAFGATGPQGPIGMSRGGAAGPGGTGNVTIYHCWDRNNDQIADQDEDINNDNIWDIQDCKEQGLSGLQGITGLHYNFSTPYVHTSSEGLNITDLSHTNLSSTSKVFVQEKGASPKVYVTYNVSTGWQLQSASGGNIPMGSIYHVVIVNP